MPLNWRSHGGTGPHLLLVHGFLCSAAQWLPNLPGLSAHFRPVTLDLLGHGESPAPEDDAPYQPAAYVAAFDALRAQLDIERWFVLGYSLGAGLTLRYALTHPDRVIGHLFTNSTSALADDDQVTRWRQRAQQSADDIRSGGLAAIERLPVHPRRATALPAGTKAALLEDAGRLSPVGIAQTVRITSVQASVRGLVGANRRPAMLLWGQRERRFEPYKCYVQASMPRLDIASLPTGHGVNMEQPERFNERVIRFAAGCNDR